MLKRALASLVLAASVAWSPVVSASGDAPSEDSTYRVFLKNGEALASYGEAARVGDRVVFNLMISSGSAGPSLELMSLPSNVVDLPRTDRYTEAKRAAFYAKTRGEADYQQLIAELGRALDQLPRIEDPAARLAAAERARQRLLDWSQSNYNYREADVRSLAAMFDDAIAELRASAGESSFSFDLVAHTAAPDPEPIAAAPTPRQSMTMALSAAAADDQPDERAAILRAVVSASSADPALDDVAMEASARLGNETRVTSEYTALAASIRARASAAMHRGDVAAVEALEGDLSAQDRALGSARPEEVRTLASAIESALDTTRAFRLKIDHYQYVRRSLLQYEREVRPALAALVHDQRLLEAIKDMRSVRFEDLTSTEARLEHLQSTLSHMVPPPDLAGVHSTIASTVRMAEEACARRRRAVVTNMIQPAHEASAAAAGALLLADRARTDLVTALYPPTLP